MECNIIRFRRRHLRLRRRRRGAPAGAPATPATKLMKVHPRPVDIYVRTQIARDERASFLIGSVMAAVRADSGFRYGRAASMAGPWGGVRKRYLDYFP